MKIIVTSFTRSPACTATLSAPDPAAGHCQPTPLPETPGHSRASLGQSPVGSLLLSPGSWCTRFCLCPSRVYFPVLCKFWRLYDGVNGELLHEGLCHTQSPCGRPLLTLTPTGDTHTQPWLSLCGSGMCFVSFPGLSNSGCSPICRSPPQSWPLGFPGVPREHCLRCAVCLLWRADLRLRPSWRMSSIQDLRKTG